MFYGSLTNLVANDATDLAKVTSGILGLDVFPTLGSEHNVAADLSHFVCGFVLRLQPAIADNHRRHIRHRHFN